MSTASWIQQPPFRYLPDRGKPSSRRAPQFFSGVVSASSSPSSSSCSCGYSEILNFDFGNWLRFFWSFDFCLVSLFMCMNYSSLRSFIAEDFSIIDVV